MTPAERAMLAELAEILGVSKRTAQRYIARDDFPKPVETYRGGRAWLRSDVEKWADKTLRVERSGTTALPRTGRPPKPRA